MQALPFQRCKKFCGKIHKKRRFAARKSDTTAGDIEKGFVLYDGLYDLADLHHPANQAEGARGGRPRHTQSKTCGTYGRYSGGSDATGLFPDTTPGMCRSRDTCSRFKTDLCAGPLALGIVAPDTGKWTSFKKITERMPGPSSRELPRISRIRGAGAFFSGHGPAPPFISGTRPAQSVPT